MILVGDCEFWIIGGSDKVIMYGDVYIFNIKIFEWKILVMKGFLVDRVIVIYVVVVYFLYFIVILVYGGYSGVDFVWFNGLVILYIDILEWEIFKLKGFVFCV